MTEYIEIIVGLIAIFTFFCTVVNYIIIKPQRLYVDKFVDAVDDLKGVVKNLDTVVTDIRNRVIKGEVEIETLRNDVDELKGYHIPHIRRNKS